MPARFKFCVAKIVSRLLKYPLRMLVYTLVIPRESANPALVIVFQSRPFLRLQSAFKIVFLRPQAWSWLKTLLLKHYYRRQGYLSTWNRKTPNSEQQPIFTKRLTNRLFQARLPPAFFCAIKIAVMKMRNSSSLSYFVDGRLPDPTQRMVLTLNHHGLLKIP